MSFPLPRAQALPKGPASGIPTGNPRAPALTDQLQSHILRAMWSLPGINRVYLLPCHSDALMSGAWLTLEGRALPGFCQFLESAKHSPFSCQNQ